MVSFLKRSRARKQFGTRNGRSLHELTSLIRNKFLSNLVEGQKKESALKMALLRMTFNVIVVVDVAGSRRRPMAENR